MECTSAMAFCWHSVSLRAVYVLLLFTTAVSGQMRVVDSFNDSGLVWKRLSMNESDPFWYNTQTGESTWDDPRSKTAFGAP